MRFQSYFNHALTLIDSYDGKLPLSHYLRQYFSGQKKHGSTDRKMISHACYSWYRLGHAMKGRPPEERLSAALFLCSDDPQKWSEVPDNSWFPAPLFLTDRIARVHERCPSFFVEDIFPWKDELSEGIDHHAFCLSFLRQPDLFLRIRPGHEKEVLQKLADHENARQAEAQPPARQFAPSVFIPPFTLRMANGFKVEELFTPDKEIVVQDYSSQRIAPYLQLNRVSTGITEGGSSVWDACAASGGKSILAHDLDPDIKLTVSDIRESILHNLGRRFRTAGIKNYHSFVADLAAPAPSAAGKPIPGRPAGSTRSAPMQEPAGPFDLIIADLPCTGSGTWSRNPEELFFFDPAKIGAYRDMQEKIVSCLVPRLGKNASLAYSTCSVFKKENEGMAGFMQRSLGLHMDRMEIIKGYHEKADTMFAGRFNP